MKRNKFIGRRYFLKKTAVGVGGTILAPTILSSCGMNDHLRIAHIGVGSHGTGVLTNWFLPVEGARSVAISDVWEDRREDRKELVTNYYKKNGIKAPDVKAYLDFEEILERNDIDAVVINTPNHWHVPVAIKAARAGKHVHLAKPLGLSYPNFKLLESEMNSFWFQWDYSIGFLAGWGAHPLDVVVWAIRDKVDGVYSCEGTGGFWDDTVGIYNNVRYWDLNYKYNNGPELHFVSLDVAEKKGLLENLITEYGRKSNNGTTFYGAKGMITISRDGANSDIPELNQKLIETPTRGANRMGQMFADAIIGGKSKETCPLDEAIISDTMSHMGNMAIRRNRRFTWDPQQGSVIDDDEAMSLFIRNMRNPYTV